VVDLNKYGGIKARIFIIETMYAWGRESLKICNQMPDNITA